MRPLLVMIFVACSLRSQALQGQSYLAGNTYIPVPNAASITVSLVGSPHTSTGAGATLATSTWTATTGNAVACWVGSNGAGSPPQSVTDPSSNVYLPQSPSAGATAGLFGTWWISLSITGWTTGAVTATGLSGGTVYGITCYEVNRSSGSMSLDVAGPFAQVSATGGGTGAAYMPTVSAGSITAYTQLASGTGYSGTVTCSDTGTGTGSGATCTGTILGGGISTVSAGATGSGYTIGGAASGGSGTPAALASITTAHAVEIILIGGNSGNTGKTWTATAGGWTSTTDGDGVSGSEYLITSSIQTGITPTYAYSGGSSGWLISAISLF